MALRCLAGEKLCLHSELVSGAWSLSLGGDLIIPCYIIVEVYGIENSYIFAVLH
jgi:hypothetical protein